MSRYLLIESRDPFETRAVRRNYQLAADLAEEGNEVTLFLVQNGVLPARKNVHRDVFAAVRGRVEILADAFSLRERGIGDGELADGVSPGPLDAVVDHLAGGHRTLWL